ncbi:hypothetical protein BH18ACT14_BH18ACT14_11310 [soil metagenome]
MELARLALAEALATNGVIGAVEGPRGLWLTVSEGEQLGGVTAVALPDGRYEIGLHLVGRLLVPLHPLAERIRSRIERAATEAGLADALGPIDIAFEDTGESAEI